MPRSAVTFAELNRLPNPLTLRAAAEFVLRAGGEIRASGDELIVELPERGPGRAEAVGASRILFAASPAVLAALRTKRAVEALPDVEPRAGGGIA